MKRWIGLLAVLLGGLSVQAGTRVQFRTAYGDVVVDLLDEEKPVTVQNFLRYVRDGRWTNMFSHRIVPGFIVQGGGFAVTNRGTASVGFSEVPDFGPITNEFNVGPKRSNVYGTIAMAKLGGDPNSASSEWFFNLADNSANLDGQNGGFTVFGQVVAGTNVLNIFNTFTSSSATQPTNRLYNLLNTGFPFDSRPSPPAFPSLALLTAFPQVYTNLIFLGVTELTIQTIQANALTNGQRGLTWTSVLGLTNRVEFSTELTGTWQELTNVVPTEASSTVIDPTEPVTDRLYRVRVGL